MFGDLKVGFFEGLEFLKLLCFKGGWEVAETGGVEGLEKFQKTEEDLERNKEINKSKSECLDGGG